MFLIKHVDQKDMYLNKYVGASGIWLTSRDTKALFLFNTYQEAFREMSRQGIIACASPHCIVKDKATQDLMLILDRESSTLKLRPFLQQTQSKISHQLFIREISEVDETF